MPAAKKPTTAKTARTAGPKKTTAKRSSPRKKTEPAQAAPAPAAKRPTRTHKRTYIFAVGRRKQAIARVRWHQAGEGGITVNNRTLDSYFPVREQQQLVQAPLVLTHQDAKATFTVKVAGGGSQGQAEAVRLGIARALVKQDADLRLPLKRAGFLRRDPRVKERKKYGLKRARRAPQWQKR